MNARVPLEVADGVIRGAISPEASGSPTAKTSVTWVASLAAASASTSSEEHESDGIPKKLQSQDANKQLAIKPSDARMARVVNLEFVMIEVGCENR